MCGFCKDRFVVGYVGTFKPRKQLWQVIDMFNTIRDTPSVLVLVGDGVDRDRVLNKTEELDLQDRVYWLGWQDEVTQLLAGMDLTILPSRFEGSPNAVLESIGVGTPVIAANVMGIADTLPPDMLFPLDDVEAASAMLRACVTDREYYSMLIKATKRCRQRFMFDWDAAIVRVIECA
jgi:glycosyltransferase involved in cell wall biosynthesis